MWNTQSCHERLGNFHFNVASSHVLTILWITRVYVTCTWNESLISTHTLCALVHIVLCTFLCSKVAEAHVPSFIFDEFRTILWRSGWSNSRRCPGSAGFGSLHCSLHTFHLSHLEDWSYPFSFWLSWVMSLWHYNPKTLAAKWNLKSTVRCNSATFLMKVGY